MENQATAKPITTPRTLRGAFIVTGLSVLLVLAMVFGHSPGGVPPGNWKWFILFIVGCLVLPTTFAVSFFLLRLAKNTTAFRIIFGVLLLGVAASSFLAFQGV